MRPYTAADTLRIAKRYNNPKRSYLLVNPLQAKHIPVSPTAALEMMSALGGQVAARYPEARLVIGFAETATAVGAAVAAQLGEDCVYLHTTREPLDGDWILFQEEHSHAVEHQLSAEHLEEWIDRSPAVVFVDDEFSTGRTLINMVRQLRARYPRLAERQLAAASLLSRVSPENLRQLAEAGIACECLVRLEEQDYEGMVASISVEEAQPPAPGPLPEIRTLRTAAPQQTSCCPHCGRSCPGRAPCWCWGRRSACTPHWRWAPLRSGWAWPPGCAATPPPAAPSASAGIRATPSGTECGCPASTAETERPISMIWRPVTPP